MKTRRKPGGKLQRQRPPLPEIVPTAPYSLRQAQRLLRRDSSRVRADIEAGRLQGRREGNRWVILGYALLAWLRGDLPQQEGR